ncbi:Sjoegren syndrome nuclear autoantigen 1 homolog isoform X2 [Frieseomelitta varia]|uniref:Sjoegren syndrome nuclear autoantigen 1 homolog isoform X2 n=1 Tax=Frieseomelitta varia TaxID=561572 RepID=UPI001CB67FD0|nr:Sjoegren syndrome nuclear autoantigen 1 homolog isoform X2 [Frieseomelitta varia]
MSQHGAALQAYNQELVKCLEEMKLRRTELQAEIESQEEEKNHLQREIEKLSYKLTRLNDSLTKKITVRNEYDRTIADTETAYIKFPITSAITDFGKFSAVVKHDQERSYKSRPNID